MYTDVFFQSSQSMYYTLTAKLFFKKSAPFSEKRKHFSQLIWWQQSLWFCALRTLIGKRKGIFIHAEYISLSAQLQTQSFNKEINETKKNVFFFYLSPQSQNQCVFIMYLQKAFFVRNYYFIINLFTGFNVKNILINCGTME